MPNGLDTKPIILICAFEGKNFQDGVNVSELTAEKLKTEYPNATIKVAVLPVDYKTIDQFFEKDVQSIKPDYIFALGEFNTPTDEQIKNSIYVAEQANLMIEKNAKNSYGTDNKYNQEIYKTIKNDSALTLKGANGVQIKQEYPALDLKARFSDSAGIYQCNYIYYKSLDYMKTAGKEGNAVFIHLEDSLAKERYLVDGKLDELAVWLMSAHKHLKDFDVPESTINAAKDFAEYAEKINLNNATKEQTSEFESKYKAAVKELFVNTDLQALINSDIPIEKYGMPTEVDIKEYDELTKKYAAVIDDYVKNVVDYLNPSKEPAAATLPSLKN
ncbi:MAG: hypothetical protein KDJ35_09170 [Alphaproteobacteria bacterium]|nr:hypothetical protein [Alphaproteobacteria bacterium]